MCYATVTNGFYLHDAKEYGTDFLAAKVEEVFDKPRILVIHDIVSDREVDEILSLASGRLRRATARNARTGQFEPADYRIR